MNGITIKGTKVITLCGSTRFKHAYSEWNARLSLGGHVVFSVGLFGHADRISLSESEKELLDDIHKIKIDMSDAIFVLNVDGYVGPSTASEIAYANRSGKNIYFMSDFV